ncbi:hypothetical protein Cgig2_022719 [Carnegiea gigantea]|uniref:Uncharacterized protein n=1 Tax=Carnegiea gigantea TaxID=171969 RepID=A0A9Q1Q6P9_9CARY|nr:hypothetical protein Cgig2_022719 [Carnegiea gigantea]
MAARELKPLMGPTMTFGPEDMQPLQTPHNGALAIQLKVATAMVCRILVDTESSIAIITLECLKKLEYSDKDLEAVEALVIGFGEQPTYACPGGTKRLPVWVGDKDNSRTVETNSVVVDIPMAYNFELDDGKVAKLYRDQKMAGECYYTSLKSLGRKEEPPSGEASQTPKIGKKSTMEAMASTKEHRKPHQNPPLRCCPYPWTPHAQSAWKELFPSDERWSVDPGGVTTRGGRLLFLVGWKLEVLPLDSPMEGASTGPSSGSDLAELLEGVGFYSDFLTTTMGGIPTLAEGLGSELAMDTFNEYDTGLPEE